jgi:hypothetical protein
VHHHAPRHHHRPKPQRHHHVHHHSPTRRTSTGLVVSSCRWQDPTQSACGSVPPTDSCHAPDGGVVEDLSCTPGAIDPRVTQANIDQTICVPGYTDRVRPPESYTAGLEPELIRSYGFHFSSSGSELDHLISLELGGAPADIRNLWPETYSGRRGATDKDVLENRLHEEVCDGQITLARAQFEIVHWVQFQLPAAAPANPPATAASNPPGSSSGPSAAGSGGNCVAGYSPCIAPGPDVDCQGGGGDGPRFIPGPVRVTGSDPYALDGNGDGLGCT